MFEHLILLVWEGSEVVLEEQTTVEAVCGALRGHSHLASNSVSLSFIFLWLRVGSLGFLPWPPASTPPCNDEYLSFWNFKSK